MSVRTFLLRLHPWVLAFGLAVHGAFACAQTLRNVPSLPLQGVGRVEAMVVQADGKIIIGGSFGYADAAGDVRVNLARFNANGTLDTTFNFKPTSTVSALAIIGNTLYLGGDFTDVTKSGGAASLRNRLAAIDLTTLTVTAWNPNADGTVYALAVSGTKLYAGGAFTFVGGVQRVGAAAFDTSVGGALTPWDPEIFDVTQPPPVFQGVVYALASVGSTMYIGGQFTNVGVSSTVQRGSIAAVDLVNGTPTAFNPVASNGSGTAVVRAIAATASMVYLGGQFSGLGVTSQFAQRIGIGAVDPATGNATAWNPGMTSGGGAVRALVLDGTTLFAGGEFTAMGGATRNHAAGIDTTIFSITALTRVGTTATAQVASTAALTSGQSVTIAGASPGNYNGVQGPITVVDGTHFTFAIAGSPTTPATGTITFAKNSDATAFDPNLDDDAHSMALTNPSTSVLIGGTFLKAGTTANPAFGGFSKTSGTISIAGYVYDSAAGWALVRQPDGKTVVAGDFFMNTGGVFYRGLVRLNTDDTLDTSWNPVVTGQVVTAALGPPVPPLNQADSVLIGGTFSKVGATARPRLAAVSIASGAATSFNANVNAPVQAITVDGATAYIGGLFNQVGGSTRNAVAAVDGITGALQAWYPAGGADDVVDTIAVDSSNVYLGGAFFTLGGQARSRLAKVAKATSAVDAWNPGADEIVYGLTVVGNTVYASGNFAALGGQARAFTGAINATTAAITAWNPNPDFIVLKVVPSPATANLLYLAGAFTNVAGTPVGNAAVVDNATGALLPWFPLMNDAVYDILPDATRVLLTGPFVDRAGVTRLALAGLTRAGVPDAPTNVSATAGNASATVSFTPPVNNGGSAITGYTVTSSPAGGVDANAGSTATTHSVTGLTNGITYTFTVVATNANGSSGPSAPSTGVTPSSGSVPGAPTNVVATAGGAQATVTFTAPASTGGSPITGYTVTSSPAGGIDSNAGSTATSHVVTNLVNGTAYTFTVRAMNINGQGPPSSASNSITPVATGTWIGYTGGNSLATGNNSAVAAGSFNQASGLGSFVGAGQSNAATGTSSLVIGGFDNRATAIDSLVGAGAGNRAMGARAVVVGGGYNLASGQWSFIGGGGRETGSGVAGASAQDHVALGKWSTIMGGQGNHAGALVAQTGSTVVGGEQNQATNSDATVAGGTGNVASGIASTVAGGASNTASGDYSFAAGRRAKATQTGSSVFADGSNFDFTAGAANEFAARAVGGVRFVSAINGSGTPTAGVSLAAGGGSWASLSDRNAKHDLAAVDANTVLAGLQSLPLFTWRYNAEASAALHMGPTAQDFRGAFGLGDSDKTITQVDADGVALAASQALYRQLQRKGALIAARAAEIAQLRRQVRELEAQDADLAQVKAMLSRLLREARAADVAIQGIHSK